MDKYFTKSIYVVLSVNKQKVQTVVGLWQSGHILQLILDGGSGIRERK